MKIAELTDDDDDLSRSKRGAVYDKARTKKPIYRDVLIVSQPLTMNVIRTENRLPRSNSPVTLTGTDSSKRAVA